MKGYIHTAIILTPLLFSCDNYNISTEQSESFIKYYAFNQVNEGAGVCEISDGGYAFLGNTKTELQGWEICLIITDAYGNSVQSAKLIGKSKDDRGYCIKPASGGGFIILGSTQKTTGTNDKDIWLIRTDHLGDTIWTKSYDGGENKDDEGKWFDLNENGDIMMAGYSTVTDLSGMSKQIWIYMVDQKGNQINSYQPIKIGGPTDVDEASYVQRIDDGWLVAGISNFFNSSFPVKHSFIRLITNDYRAEAWEESENNANEEAISLTVFTDNTYLICGTTSDIAGETDVLLYKIKKVYADDNKVRYEREWTRSFNNSGVDKGTCIQSEDNKIHILSTWSNGDKTSIISIITSTLEDESQQYMTIGGSSQMESQSFGFSSDGGFIISGTNLSNNFSSMTFIKTKAGGKF
ncbi:MAG: hypothetical protein JW973_13260 [Bacteroidales bacterium]|nr:hypothetical protein [Bacteroidales bacterium]